MKNQVISLVAWCLLANYVGAQVSIDVEVALEPGVPITAPQQWAERLGKLGLSRVQIRSLRGDETPLAKFNEGQSRIQVVAILTSREELVVPQGRFRTSDLAKLREYFEQLPTILAEEGVERGLFGLTVPQMKTVLADLGRPVKIATAEMNVRDLLDHCERRFQLPIRGEQKVEAVLSVDIPLVAELQSLTTGTALAIALRKSGLTIRPRQTPTGELELVISDYQRGREVWPVGWKPAGSPRQAAPQLFAALTVEIQGYTLATALQALGPRLGLPVVRDETILNSLDIRPEEIAVKLPRKKTTLKNALDRMCSQARLAAELRVDESEKAFLWITQFGPDSRPVGGR